MDHYWLTSSETRRGEAEHLVTATRWPGTSMTSVAGKELPMREERSSALIDADGVLAARDPLSESNVSIARTAWIVAAGGMNHHD